MVKMDCRLATYGTLRPGEANHHEVAGLAGVWRHGSVTGRVAYTGWGAAFGHPALTLSPDGATIPVDLLESADLPAHWARLDAFEGRDYRRARVVVATGEGPVEAWIYVAAGG